MEQHSGSARRADRVMSPSHVVIYDYVLLQDPATGQRSVGEMLESSPMRIAVTRAWARLEAPSFW